MPDPKSAGFAEKTVCFWLFKSLERKKQGKANIVLRPCLCVHLCLYLLSVLVIMLAFLLACGLRVEWFSLLVLRSVGQLVCLVCPSVRLPVTLLACLPVCRLPLCLSACLSVSLSVRLSVYVCRCLFVSGWIDFSVCPCLSLSPSPSHCLSLPVSHCLSVCLFAGLCLFVVCLLA